MSVTPHHDEAARQPASRQGTLSGVPEPALDDLVRLVALALQVPMACAVLIDGNRIRVGAALAMEDSEALQSSRFWTHTAERRELLIVPDALADPQFAADPLVLCAPEARFYAGVPLISTQGNVFGILAALDRVARIFGPEQTAALEALGRQTTAHLELHTLRIMHRNEMEERQRVERTLRNDSERLAAIVATQRDVAAAQLESNVVMDLIAERTRLLTGADGAAIEIIDGEDLVARSACGIAAPDAGLRQRASDSLSGRCIHSGKTLWCDDTETDGRVDRETCRRLEIRSMLLLPLHVEEAVIGVLKVVSRAPSAFDEWAVFTLQFMAEMIASATSHATAFEAKQALLAERTAALTALRENEEWFRLALNAMQEGLVLQDVNGVIRLCSRGAEQILGLSAEHIAGNRPLDANWHTIHEDGSEFPEHARPVTVSLRTGRPQRNIAMGIYRRPDEVRWISVNSLPLFHAGQESPYATVVTINDITERKRCEYQLEEQMLQINQYGVELELQKAELEAANARLQALAVTDGLTGLNNHRAFQDELERNVERCARYNQPLSLLMLDVDNFKRFNDRFGHPAGDEILTIVAQVIQRAARASDFVARYGGEEFMVVLPNTDGAGALTMAERFRALIEVSSWNNQTLTASFGVTTLSATCPDRASLIAQADRALYFSKQHGRNRVTHYHQTLATPRSAA